MGVHHGLAQLVGGRTGIPHGLANAVILPHAMRFNADGGARGDGRASAPRSAHPDDPAGAVAALVARLGLPTQLSDVRRHRRRPRRGRPAVAGEPRRASRTRGPSARTTPAPILEAAF